jgi:signal transduction histidine kinase
MAIGTPSQKQASNPFSNPEPKPDLTPDRKAHRKTFPLRVVLIVPFILQLLGAVGLVGYLSYRNGEQSVNDLANKLMDEVGSRVVDNLETHVQIPGQLNQAKLNAIATGTLNPTKVAGWEKFLWYQIQGYPYINITSIAMGSSDYRAAEKLSNGSTRINESGENTQQFFFSYETDLKGDRGVIASKIPDADVRKHSGFMQAAKAGKPIWTDPYVSFLEPTLILSEMHPLKNAKGQLDAILIASLRLDYLGKYLSTLKTSKTGQVFIMERSGKLIATSSSELPFRIDSKKRELIQAIDSTNPLTRSTAQTIKTRFPIETLKTEQRFNFVDNTGRSQFVRILPFSDSHGLDWLVAVVVPESDFMSQIQENRRNTIFLSLGALGLALGIGIWTVRWVVRPIGDLNRAARAIAAGDWSRTPNLDRSDEVGELATSFSSMASQLQTSFKNLEDVNQTLEIRVADRTKELSETLTHLQTTQLELVQSEKMAALGQLVAGIAHEINTPIGAIRAASGNSLQALDLSLAKLPELMQMLDETHRSQFFALIDRSLASIPLLSTKEKRQAKRKLLPDLEALGMEDPRQVSDTLIDMGIYDNLTPFAALLQHPQSNFILEVAYNVARLKGNSTTVQMAVDRVAKIVFALKSYARRDHSSNSTTAQVTDGLDTVLTLYENQLRVGIEVKLDYQSPPTIECYPDELNQVWNNLVHNAIQAMQGKGTLEITARSPDRNHVQVQIIDSGSGIPDDVLPRIFEPFFTTKPIGEGSGLGLDIVKKIIDKHQGQIAVTSQPGHTCFTVLLPKTLERNE